MVVLGVEPRPECGDEHRVAGPPVLTFRRRLWMMGRMFGPLGFQEVILILVVALLIFGPRKLPEIGRTIGRTLSEFRKASTELKRSLNAEIADEELRQSDPRKLVRETVAEVKSLGAELTRPATELLTPGEPEAVPSETEGSGLPESESEAPPPAPAGAVSRGPASRGPASESDSAADPDPERSTP